MTLEDEWIELTELQLEIQYFRIFTLRTLPETLLAWLRCTP